MSENLIENITTKNDFEDALHTLGINPSDKCIVHTALSKFYYVPGTSETVVDALEEMLSNGTLIMPSQVSDNCDPATWMYPPVRKDLIQKVRDAMPPYNLKTSVTIGIGKTPEYFRTSPGVYRSNHPYLPLAIWGKNAASLAATQPMDLPYGAKSPLDYLYQNNGKTIFLGTDYETCTILHLAESTINRKLYDYSAATGRDENGKTIWTTYKNVDLDSYDDFNDLGAAFEEKYPNEWSQVKLGHGIIKVINIHPLIDFARQWFIEKDRNL